MNWERMYWNLLAEYARLWGFIADDMDDPLEVPQFAKGPTVN